MLEGALQRFEPLTRYVALAGGAMMLALIAMSVASILGRRLFNTPILGDVELMQMGTAFGAASFLPYCEMRDLHIRVDITTARLSSRSRSILEAVAHGLLTAMASILAYRTFILTEATFRSGEVSTLLAIPMWIPIALLVPSLALLALAGIFRAGSAAERAMGCRQ